MPPYIAPAQVKVPFQMAMRLASVMLVTLFCTVLAPPTTLNVVHDTPSVAYSTSLSVELPLWDEARAKVMGWVGVPAAEDSSAVAPLPEPMGGASTE